jgi:hypothetical protein
MSRMSAHHKYRVAHFAPKVRDLITFKITKIIAVAQVLSRRPSNPPFVPLDLKYLH